MFSMDDSFLHRPKQLLMQSGLMYQQGPGKGVFCDMHSSNAKIEPNYFAVMRLPLLRLA
jgi:hypothetical protein